MSHNWKDHHTAQLVNALRDCVVTYGQTQQLRERIAAIVAPLCYQLKAQQAVLQPAASSNERDHYFFLAGWNGANSACDATEHFHQVRAGAPAKDSPIAYLRAAATLPEFGGLQIWKDDGTAFPVFAAPQAGVDAKDAERYRWLRSRDLDTISQGGVFAGMTPKNVVLNEEDLDAAVDAAIAAASALEQHQ